MEQWRKDARKDPIIIDIDSLVPADNASFIWNSGSNLESVADGISVAEGGSLQVTSAEAAMKNAGAQGIYLAGTAVISVNGDSVTIYGSPEEETVPAAPTEDAANTEPTEQYPYDFTLKSFFDVEDCHKYAPLATLEGVTADAPFFQVPGIDHYSVGQGAVSDGTYGYFCLSSGTNANMGRIRKVDLRTWEIVVDSEELPIGHCNGIAYNDTANKLVVAHYTNGKLLSIVDPDTLEVVDTVETSVSIGSISYNASHGLYVVRVKTTFDFVLLDENFEQVAYCKGVDSKIGKQCSFCDDDYIYLLDSGVIAKPGTECFTVYDWDGNYLGVYKVDSFQETEAIFTYNGEYYITFYQSGARVYKMNFDKSLLPW